MMTRKHEAGKTTGYDIEDGIYYPCPSYVEQFFDISDRRTGATDLLNAVTHFVQKDLARLAKEQRGLWDKIGEDYGQEFGIGSGWVFRYLDHALVPPPVEETPDAS